MKKIVFVFVLIVLMLTGCQATPVNQQPKQSQELNINFEIADFNLKYEKDDGKYFTENYRGEATIIATGHEDLVKKPYLVLVKITKISGGEKNNSGGIRTYIVNNGVGKLNTYDTNFDDTATFAKPEYEFEILGYISFKELQQQNINKK